MTGKKSGRAGCGCLVFVVIILLVLAAAFVHPFSLRLLTGLLVYQDRIVPADALLVPRFIEDKNGELYQEAFREFWAGNGKTVYVQDDHILGMSLKEIVSRMAKQRGIKEDVVKALELNLEGKAGAAKAKEALAHAGANKVIVIVPEYASERFHLLYSSGSTSDKVLFLIKPVSVSYFKRERWWSNEFSRAALERELFGIGSFYFSRFKYGREEADKR